MKELFSDYFIRLFMSLLPASGYFLAYKVFKYPSKISRRDVTAEKTMKNKKVLKIAEIIFLEHNLSCLMKRLY